MQGKTGRSSHDETRGTKPTEREKRQECWGTDEGIGRRRTKAGTTAGEEDFDGTMRLRKILQECASPSAEDACSVACLSAISADRQEGATVRSLAWNDADYRKTWEPSRRGLKPVLEAIRFPRHAGRYGNRDSGSLPWAGRNRTQYGKHARKGGFRRTMYGFGYSGASVGRERVR